MTNQTEPTTDEREPTATASSGRQATLLKVGGAILGVVALLVLGRQTGSAATEFARWVEGLGVWGPVVFVAGYVAATLAFVPGSFLSLAGGAIFGLVEGTLLVFCAATLGATLAFLTARYLARSTVESRLEGHPRFEQVDAAVGRQGLKIVMLLRLSPAFPFNLLNYALGLTRVRFGHYLVGCLGMLPGTFLYVYYGKAVGDLAALAAGQRPDRGAGEWTLLGLGLVATVVVTWIVTRIARRALNEEVEGPRDHRPGAPESP